MNGDLRFVFRWVAHTGLLDLDCALAYSRALQEINQLANVYRARGVSPRGLGESMVPGRRVASSLRRARRHGKLKIEKVQPVGRTEV